MDTSDQIWLEDLILIWLDSHIGSHPNNDEILHKLRTCINHLKMYNDPNECINYISCLAPTAQRIILIVSSTFGEYIIPLINDLPQLISIYVFANVDQPKSLDLKTKTFFSIDQLVHQLVLDAKKYLKQSFTSTIIYSNEKTFRHLSVKTDNVMFMWAKLLIDILLKMPKTLYRARQDILNELRLKYMNNSRYEDEINEFERTYQSTDAIKWYTRDCFLYRILNQAFRTEDIHVIYRYRFFFNDLYENIKRLHTEQQETLLKDIDIVYRGQCINVDEFNKLYQNIGSLIVMNSFLSTTVTRELALMYSGDGEQKPDKESIIYEIHFDEQFRLSQPFANIRQFSIFPDEDEILFATGTIFYIDSIYPEGNRWIFKLILTDGKLPNMDDLNQYQNIFASHGTTLTTLGNILMEMGQYENAEKYFQLELLSKDAPPIIMNDGRPVNSEEVAANVWHHLENRNEEENIVYDNPSGYLLYGGSPTQQELVSRMLQRGNMAAIGVTYNHLGLVNHYMEKYDKALSYYNQALEFYYKSAELFRNHRLVQDSHSVDLLSPHSFLLRTHSNIGLTYIRIEAYLLAKRNFKLALDWYQKATASGISGMISEDEPALVYHNMGDLYASVLKYDTAIEYFNRALDIYSQANVPNSHPTVSNTYHNLTNAYLGKKDIKSALASIKKAYDLTINILPSTHPHFILTVEMFNQIQSYTEDYIAVIDIAQAYLSEKLTAIRMSEGENCYQRGIQFFKQRDYHIALENLLQSAQLGRATTELYILIANIYEKKGDRSEAIVYYEKAIKSTTDNDYIDRCYLNMAKLYTLEKEYQNAIILNEKRLQVMMNQFNHSEFASIYKTIANLYRCMNNSKDELLNWEQALEYGSKSDNNILLSEIHLGIGDAYYHDGNFNLAEKYYEQAKYISQNSSVSSSKNLYSVYNKLGNLYEHGKIDHELAFEYYQKALRIANIDLKSTINDIIASAHYNLALLHYKIEDYLSAIDCCQTAIDTLLSALEKNDDTHHLLQKIYHTMAQVYLANNDADQAYETFRKLWLTGIYKDHPTYEYLRSQFYHEHDGVGIACLPS